MANEQCQRCGIGICRDALYCAVCEAGISKITSPPMSPDRTQVGGTHYINMSVQPWDAMRAWMTHEQFCGYLRGCAIKYLARYPHKGGAEDVKKAHHYLDALVQEMDRAARIAKATEATDGN
jgi:hypothetical protein